VRAWNAVLKSIRVRNLRGIGEREVGGLADVARGDVMAEASKLL
jgi:hypothetical protein